MNQNDFEGHPSVTKALAAAINSSHLQTLSLATNRTLSDQFVEHFLPALDSPHFREIHLSAMDLTSRSTPYIVSFISYSRCSLHTLKCNGNSLGFRSVMSIIRALERCNFRLFKVELYSNQLADGHVIGSNSDVDDGDDVMSAKSNIWKDSERKLKQLLLRNDYLKKVTETDAVRLLSYSRVLLFRPRCPIASRTSNRLPITPPTFPFCILPTELQLYTLIVKGRRGVGG
jgi:hypothetical protein